MNTTLTLDNRKSFGCDGALSMNSSTHLLSVFIRLSNCLSQSRNISNVIHVFLLALQVTDRFFERNVSKASWLLRLANDEHLFEITLKIAAVMLPFNFILPCTHHLSLSKSLMVRLCRKLHFRQCWKCPSCYNWL